MRIKTITEILSCENFNQVMDKLNLARNSSEYELVEVNIKMKDVKENGEVIGVEYIVKLVKSYE